MSKYVKITMPTGRELYVNSDNVTVISEDPMNKDKTAIYMSDGNNYLLGQKLDSILKLFNVNDK